MGTCLLFLECTEGSAEHHITCPQDSVSFETLINRFIEFSTAFIDRLLWCVQGRTREQLAAANVEAEACRSQMEVSHAKLQRLERSNAHLRKQRAQMMADLQVPLPLLYPCLLYPCCAPTLPCLLYPCLLYPWCTPVVPLLYPCCPPCIPAVPCVLYPCPLHPCCTPACCTPAAPCLLYPCWLYPCLLHTCCPCHSCTLYCPSYACSRWGWGFTLGDLTVCITSDAPLIMVTLGGGGGEEGLQPETQGAKQTRGCCL